MSGIWWFPGIAWIWYGMFVLSYQVGSLVAVAALVGVAFLFGGIGQLVVAGRVETWRWLFIVTEILAVAAGIMTFAWPDITLYVVSILVAWYLIVFGIVHLVSALAGPKVPWWWTQLLLGIAEVFLGVWAVRSWERSLLTFVTLVGVWGHLHWDQRDLRRVLPARGRQASGADDRLTAAARSGASGPATRQQVGHKGARTSESGPSAQAPWAPSRPGLPLAWSRSRESARRNPARTARSPPRRTRSPSA